MRRSLSLIAVVLVAAFGPVSHSEAQQWPVRQVSMIVPFPPGGSTDIVARLIAQRFTQEFGQPFTVENRAGASGNIGASAVARAEPNGYTLLFSTSGPVATNVLMFKQLGFNPVDDFTPIALVAEIPVAIIANPKKLQATGIQQLLAFDKANPGKLNFGHAGTGVMGHMAGELLARSAGAKFTTVPYQGSAPATIALLAGEVDFNVDLLTTYTQHIKAGTLRALAVTTSTRLPELPDVPTVAEQGVAGYEASAFVALMGPGKLPADIVQKLNKSTNDWLASAAGKQALTEQILRPIGGTPEAVKQRVAKEIDKWRPVVQDAKIALD